MNIQYLTRFLVVLTLAFLTHSFGFGKNAINRTLSISLEGGKSQFVHGEKIPLRFIISGNSGNFWAVLVPNTTQHGNANQARNQALNSHYFSTPGSGTFSFTAPSKAGFYDVRVFSGDYPETEVSSILLTVKAGEPTPDVPSGQPARITVEMKRSWIYPREPMKVNYVLPGKDLDGAWIGLFAEGTGNDKAVSRTYIYKAGAGKATMRAPSNEGVFELRLFNPMDSEALTTFSFRVSK